MTNQKESRLLTPKELLDAHQVDVPFHFSEDIIICQAQDTKSVKARDEEWLGWVDKKVNKIESRIKELNELREPLIDKMDDGWSDEEQRFMYDSVQEIVNLPRLLSLLEELRQALKRSIDADK